MGALVRVDGVPKGAADSIASWNPSAAAVSSRAVRALSSSASSHSSRCFPREAFLDVVGPSKWPETASSPSGSDSGSAGSSKQFHVFLWDFPFPGQLTCACSNPSFVHYPNLTTVSPGTSTSFPSHFLDPLPSNLTRTYSTPSMLLSDLSLLDLSLLW